MSKRAPRGKSRSNGRSALAVALIGMACASAAAEPVEHLCPDVTAVVRGGDKRNVSFVCAAAATAVATLRQCGVATSDPLLVRIVDVPPSQAGVHGYGCFDPSTNVISIMSLDQCITHLRSDEARAGVDALDYYRSVIIHEVAHNVGFRVAQERDVTLPFLAHEYLAYALQMDALSEASRRALIDRLSTKAPDGNVVPNELVLFMNPTAFAIGAWRHFRTLGSRCDAISKVFGGQVNFRQPYE